MSSFEFYKKQGYSHWDAQTGIDTANTSKTVYTPKASTRIVLTNLQIAANVAGSVQVFIGGAVNRKIFQANMAGSTFISPVISGIESTALDAVLYAVVSSSSGNGWQIGAEGFELD
jgi:hypothetical protein